MSKFFIEIGSADFNTLLPLAKNGWNGIIVEPNTELINNLEVLDNVIYENIAITDDEGVGVQELKYYDPKTTLGSWRRGVSNLRWGYGTDPVYDIFRRPGNRHWVKDLRVQKISCITLDNLLEKHNVEHIDFLKVDTEGYEYKIFESYSWNILPEILQIEIAHWWNRGITDEQIKEFVLLEIVCRAYFC